MLAHVSIGVRDIAAARRFYDAVLGTIGYTLIGDYGTALGYGAEQPDWWLNATEHPVPADTRSGLHFCFTAPSRAAVDAFHAAAVKAGGRDNGKPGLRADYDPNYYAAFIIDPDGYRIEALCLSAA
jgi:catechol 2,3-dioxygenase-like lactoylglutathione lyase family enzyme